MRRAASITYMIAAAAVVLCVTGCQARGVSVPPGSDQLVPCEPALISVEDLGDMGAPGCDLAGSSLTFSDSSFPVTIPTVGAVVRHGDGSSREYLLVNWGVPGVGAAEIEAGRLRQVWTTGPEALSLTQQQLAVENIAPAK